MKWIDLEDRLPPQDVAVLVSYIIPHRDYPSSGVQIATRYGNGSVDDHDGDLVGD